MLCNISFKKVRMISKTYTKNMDTQKISTKVATQKSK